MFRKIITAFCFIACCAGAAQVSAQQKYTVDKVVAVVGNSAILYSDLVKRSEQIVEDRRQEGYTTDRDPMNEALEALMLQKVMHNQAQIDSIQINTAQISVMVEENLQQQISDAGSIAKLETREGKAIFEIRQTLMRQIEEMAYAQQMQASVVSDVRITPGEVERFYNKMDKSLLLPVPEQYSYSQITRFPSNTSQAKQRARERLMELRERIINGDRFDFLARMYSVDGSASRGGELDYMPLEGLASAYAATVEKLRLGQVSEVVETEFGFHIIELLDKKGNMYKTRHILIRPTFTDEELNETDRFLDSLANEIRSGSITFEEAARKHSEDKHSRQNGGVVTNHEYLEAMGAHDTGYSLTKFRREYFQYLGLADYNKIRTMAVGEISNAFRSQDLRGNMLSKIIKLDKIIPTHQPNLNDDYLDIENYALTEKQSQVFEKWLLPILESTYIKISPEFRDGDFQHKGWVK